MVDADWHWGISNPGPARLLIWLEPWAEEYDVPVRSSLTITVFNDRPDAEPFEVEDNSEYVVIWANGGDRIEVAVDGVVQDSGSAMLEVPDVGISPKRLLNIGFANLPAARVGGLGAGAPMPLSWWQRLKRAFRPQ